MKTLYISRVYIYIYILYNVRVLDHFWPPVVRVTPLKTSFGLSVDLLQSSPTRNYNHSQLFLTLCHIYTAYNHTPSWLQSLITLLHWLTSQLSITVSDYHTLYIFTLQNSRRDLTLRIHLLRLLLKNSSRELLPKNWLLRHFSSSYKPSIVQTSLQQRAR
jgi:hypothetical protein